VLLSPIFHTPLKQQRKLATREEEEDGGKGVSLHHLKSAA
jgi:hypothetical protein